MEPMPAGPALFRALADPTRLRILRALAHDPFNVSELTRIVAVAQSGVSRHLGLLKDAGLVVEDRHHGFVYYRLARDVHPGTPAPVWRVLEPHLAEEAVDTAARADDARREEVLRHRRESFEPHVDARQWVPGRSWAAWARALGHLLPPLEVADIGCGDGYLAVEMAAWARLVTGIDRSDDVLERAKALAERRHVTNIAWTKGDLARLPLREASVDLALLSQALHHASDPERAVGDAVRVLRPGGRLLVLDLKAHDQTWVRSRFGDRRLGFSASELEALAQGAGLTGVRVTVGAGRTRDPFTVLIASGTKPHGPVSKRMPAAPRPRAGR
jgi:ArsR family transcriptional regulator